MRGTLNTICIPTSETQQRRGPSVALGTSVFSAPWVIVFALGFLSNFVVHVFGSLTIAEPVAALLLPILVSSQVLRRSEWFPQFDRRRFAILIVALLVSVVGYLLSDLYWGSSLLQSAKGVARFAVLGVNAWVLWTLLQKHHYAWVGFILGIVVGRIAVTLIQPPLFNDYWKFGFALPVTYGCLLLTAWLGRPYLVFTTLLLLGLAVLNAYLGSRSAALLIFMFAAQRPISYRKSMAYRFGLGAVAVVGMLALLAIGSQGVRQSTTRSDIERWTHIQFCLDGIARHPLVGNGTWYEASGYVEHYYELLYRNSEYGRYGGFETGSGPLQISIHAQLLNGWAEGGILGSVFFLVCFAWSLYDLLFVPVDSKDPADGIRDFFLLQCLMGLAFSPFSGLSRWPLAFQLWFLLKKRWRPETHVFRRPPTFAEVSSHG